MDKHESFQIEFQPLGLRDSFDSGLSLLECAQKANIDLVSLCGGTGTCKKCRVQVVSGEVSDPLQEEVDVFSVDEISKGFRLACKTYAKSDLVLNIPAESLSAPQRLQVEGIEINIKNDPVIKRSDVFLSPPSLNDLKGDDRRLFESIRNHYGSTVKSIDNKLARSMSPLLRSMAWKASAAVRGTELISLGPAGESCLGMAVDLGTTKIAGYLVDLESGKTLSSKGVMNPQISFGEDVIARISKAQVSEEGASTLQGVVVEALNRLSRELCDDAGNDYNPGDIKEFVIAGNTAMHHLFLHLPVDQLARAPHVPAISTAVDIKARNLGLEICEGAYVHCAPNIAGFVGGDHVTMLLAIDAWEADGPLLAVDIGTNTEISLVARGGISSVSCASGPAFEGAHISCGMRAGPGAIDHVRIVDGLVEYHTIHSERAAGICGSGIFDALAQLSLNDIINMSGRINSDHPRVREGRSGREFIIVGEDEAKEGAAISITQSDVRELQLAKAAIRTGIDILLRENNFSAEDIKEVVVAGAFGSYLDIAATISIGMFPPVPLDRFRQVGNAAGAGAKAVLISKSLREDVQDRVKDIRYIELAGAEDFNRIYMNAINIG